MVLEHLCLLCPALYFSGSLHSRPSPPIIFYNTRFFPAATAMLTDLEKDAIRRHYQAISENLPHFRPRKAQREMLATVANTL